MPDGSIPALQCVIAYNRFGGYCVPLASSDRRTSGAILAGRVHEPRTIEFILAHCAEGDIIHAGAYFGDFLPVLSRGCATGAHIWAFEPGSENYRCALITMQINDLQNVTLAHAGLGSNTQRASMIIMDKWGRAKGPASRVAATDQTLQPGHTEQIELVRIDDVIPPDRRVSILHLDVEKYEQQALQGGLKTIQRCKPILILETMPGESWMAEHIFPLGYTLLEQHLEENAVLLPPD